MGHEKHECPRCGCQWDARNGAYRDELIEWMQHFDATRQDYRQQLAEQQERLGHEVFMAQTRAVILEAELLLLRHDVAEALRKVPAEVEVEPA